MMNSSDRFFHDLRSALNHLYDPEYLAKSPLIHLFGLQARYDRAAALQQCLIKAIETLRPRPGDLLAEHNQQAYDLLLYRYIQRLTQEEMAHQFGISERQLRRDQNRAVQLLAARLWEQYGLEQKLATANNLAHVEQSKVAGGESFEWLVQDPTERLTDPNQTFVTVIELIQPLVERYGVRLDWSAPADLPPLSVHPIAFRQIVIALLGHALQCAARGWCAVRISEKANVLTFEITAQWPNDGRALASADLKEVEDLIELFRGHLICSLGQNVLDYRIALPICNRWPVLLIDDNPDIFQLFQRYVAGTRYQVISAQEPGRALDLLETHSPRMIVLDIMMPHMDGWALLRKLRSHPLAGRLPIVVCTIMNQPELAYALGANAFLRKPVTQTAFLETLERLAASTQSGAS